VGADNLTEAGKEGCEHAPVDLQKVFRPIQPHGAVLPKVEKLALVWRKGTLRFTHKQEGDTSETGTSRAYVTGRSASVPNIGDGGPRRSRTALRRFAVCYIAALTSDHRGALLIHLGEGRQATL
jgi:hypothetical protein